MARIPKPGTETALPSRNVANGATWTTASFNVPTGTRFIEIELDGSGWSPNLDLTVDIEVSENGGSTWRQECGIRTNATSLAEGVCAIGVAFLSENGNSNNGYRVRSVVRPVGAAFNLVGRVRVS